MNYLILYNNSAFYTNWFDAENNYLEGMTVFNLISDKYTVDGKTWLKISEDHL